VRELIAFVTSWAVVTTIFVVAVTFNGFELSDYNPIQIWGLFGVFSGVYFIVIGIPVFYFLCKFKKVARSAFIYSGLAASLPILVLSIVTKEPVWVIASVLGGFVGGLVFAILLPFKKYT